MGFEKATRKDVKLRLALIGPSGSGKTYSALSIAAALVPGGRVAVIDTEHRSASKYAPKPGQAALPAKGTFDFEVEELTNFEPKNYIDAIHAAEDAGFDVLVIDSLTHAWNGVGGILDQLDRKSGNFNAWKNLTPQHNALIEAMLACRCHLIATIRAKQQYEVDKDERGKPVPTKIGMGAVQREGMEYEFDVVFDLDVEHVAIASKTRCSDFDGRSFRKPGADVAKILHGWLAGGAPVAAAAAAPSPAPSEPAAPVDWLVQIEQARTAAKPGAQLFTVGQMLGAAHLNGTRDAVLAAYGVAVERWLRSLGDVATLEQAAKVFVERVPESVRAPSLERIERALADRRAELSPSQPEPGAGG